MLKSAMLCEVNGMMTEKPTTNPRPIIVGWFDADVLRILLSPGVGRSASICLTFFAPHVAMLLPACSLPDI